MDQQLNNDNNNNDGNGDADPPPRPNQFDDLQSIADSSYSHSRHSAPPSPFPDDLQSIFSLPPASPQSSLKHSAAPPQPQPQPQPQPPQAPAPPRPRPRPRHQSFNPNPAPPQVQSNNMAQQPQQPPQPQQAPNGCLKAHYHQQPPAGNRRPPKLYNLNCGASYKSVGALGISEIRLFRNMMNTELFEVISVFLLIYHWRNNTIIGPKYLSRDETAAIFDTDLVDFQVSLPEFYKRYLMRKKQFNRDSAAMNWWELPEWEIFRFMDFLDELQDFEDRALRIWRFGKDSEGKWYAKLHMNRISCNYIQIINAMHDSIKQWDHHTHRGVEWIAFTQRGAYFTAS